MLMTTGRVREGKIEVDSGCLPEGASVTILVGEGNETFELNAADEAELLSAIAQADRGEVVSASDLLHDLRES